MTILSTSELRPTTARGSDLPYEDGIPLESSWHLDAMYLLMSILRYFWRDRSDVYIGANMFVYFDPDQDKRRNFRGPDFFVIKGGKDNSPRQSWVVWEEEGLTPDLVVELASESTVEFDLTEKKEIYEQLLKTQEYVVYNPMTKELRGWRLVNGRYEPLAPDQRGWLWCSEVGLWLGVAEHRFVKQAAPLPVLRFFDEQGGLVLTETEAEARRAETAEAEVARLKALLKKKGTN